jgi:GntP family gluconate:H+ symporter
MFAALLILVIVVLTVIATTRFKLHPFITLLLAAVAIGFFGGLPPDAVLESILKGFGSTLQKIGIVIACGTIIGTLLERSGAARTMASSVTRMVGEKNAPLAMSITGLIVSVPVFCDSGFVILSSLNRALSRKTGLSLAILAVALGTGLYATHVFVPPTPGPLAAAGTIGADIGLTILLGMVVSIPAAAAGLLWALYYCRRFQISTEGLAENEARDSHHPGAAISFAPLIIPVVLIGLKSVADYPTHPFGQDVLSNVVGFIGHPVVALMIGVFIAFALQRSGSARFESVSLGLKNAGGIILITGAGGALGNVLRTTDIGANLGEVVSHWQLGIFLPFLIAAALKSAQGSSTVAIITTAALLAPLLEPMGLTTTAAKALVVLAIGAGSMTVSHVNDSYFWVVSQFSDMDTATALRCHTLATLMQGLAGIGTIAILAWVLT